MLMPHTRGGAHRVVLVVMSLLLVVPFLVVEEEDSSRWIMVEALEELYWDRAAFNFALARFAEAYAGGKPRSPPSRALCLVPPWGLTCPRCVCVGGGRTRRQTFMP